MILASIKKHIENKIKKIILSSIPEFYDILKYKSMVEEGATTLQNNFYNVKLGLNCKVYKPSDINECNIGDYTYIARNSVISQTTIGKFCSIGPNLVCGWGLHPTEALSTHPMFYSTRKQNGITISSTDKIQERKPIFIGNDVFIGANVTILDGITIGDGAVIGAGAVISKNVPPYAVVVGCPMQILHYRFSEPIRERLEQIKWWNFDDSSLCDVEEFFFTVEDFIKKYDYLNEK